MKVTKENALEILKNLKDNAEKAAESIGIYKDRLTDKIAKELVQMEIEESGYGAINAPVKENFKAEENRPIYNSRIVRGYEVIFTKGYKNLEFVLGRDIYLPSHYAAWYQKDGKFFDSIGKYESLDAAISYLRGRFAIDEMYDSECPFVETFYCPLLIGANRVSPEGVYTPLPFTARTFPLELKNVILESLKDINKNYEADKFDVSDRLQAKFKSAEWTVEERFGVLYGRIDVLTSLPIYDNEKAEVIDWIQHMNRDGIGRAIWHNIIEVEDVHTIHIQVGFKNDFVMDQDSFEVQNSY